MAAIQHPPRRDDPLAVDYHTAEGFAEGDPGVLDVPHSASTDVGDTPWREWIMVGLGLCALVAILAIALAVFALADSTRTTDGTVRTITAPPAAVAAGDAPAAAKAPTLADAKGVDFERFTKVDATLPASPAGPVKKFKVDVFQHVTQVSKDLAPTEVWSFAVNGTYHRGTGVSAPMVVTEGDTVDFTLVNGSDASMKVNLPHSLDFHSAEVNPGKRYMDLAPGKSMHYRFKAEHPGVFMYHCATQPVLMHTGAPGWSACSWSSPRAS